MRKRPPRYATPRALASPAVWAVSPGTPFAKSASATWGSCAERPRRSGPGPPASHDEPERNAAGCKLLKQAPASLFQENAWRGVSSSRPPPPPSGSGQAEGDPDYKNPAAPAMKREAGSTGVGNDGCFACLKCRVTVFGNCKNITVAECCDCAVAGIAPLGQSKDNHDLARFVIALHKKAPVTVYRPPGLSIRRSVSCHSPRP
jgi:hypothetical protein